MPCTEPCPFFDLFHLLSMLNKEPANSPKFLLRASSLRIKSLIPSNVNFVVPEVLAIVVIVPTQQSGNEHNNNKACTL